MLVLFSFEGIGALTATNVAIFLVGKRISMERAPYRSIYGFIENLERPTGIEPVLWV